MCVNAFVKRKLFLSALAQPGGVEGLGEPVPPFESAQFHKNFLKKIKCQKTNLKTLNSSVIPPQVSSKQCQNFLYFLKFFSKVISFSIFYKEFQPSHLYCFEDI